MSDNVVDELRHSGEGNYLELRGCLRTLPYDEAIEWADYLVDVAPRPLSAMERAIVAPILGALSTQQAMEVSGSSRVHQTMRSAFIKLTEGVTEDNWENLRIRAQAAKLEAEQLVDDLESLSPTRRAQYIIKLMARAQPFEETWREAVQHVVVEGNSRTSLMRQTGAKTDTTNARIHRGLMEFCRYTPSGFPEEVRAVLSKEALAASYTPAEFRAVMIYIEPEERKASMISAMDKARKHDVLMPIDEELLTVRFIDGSNLKDAAKQLAERFGRRPVELRDGVAISLLLPFIDGRIADRLLINQVPRAAKPPTTTDLKRDLALLPPDICKRLIESMCSREHAASLRDCQLLKLIYAEGAPEKDAWQWLGFTKETTFWKFRNIAVAKLAEVYNLADQAVMEAFLDSKVVGDEAYFQIATAAAYRALNGEDSSEDLGHEAGHDEPIPDTLVLTELEEAPTSQPEAAVNLSPDQTAPPEESSASVIEIISWQATLRVDEYGAGLWQGEREIDLPELGAKLLVGLFDRPDGWPFNEAMVTLGLNRNQLRLLTYGVTKKLETVHIPGRITLEDEVILLEIYRPAVPDATPRIRGGSTMKDLQAELNKKASKKKGRDGRRYRGG